MSDGDFDTAVAGIAALGEPVRRDLYRFVAAQPDAVSRDEAAAGVEVPRHVAKFHLDKLVDEGLLTAEFSRPAGRRGPGAGRPTKRYRRSEREVVVSLPERHYELAGRLLAQAVTDAQRHGVPVGDALRDAARDAGRTLGEQARSRAGPAATHEQIQQAATSVLVDCGYEPRADDADLILVNCPFHALAQEYTELVCGMNLELIRGLGEGLRTPTFEPYLAPAPGRCCVQLRATT